LYKALGGGWQNQEMTNSEFRMTNDK